MAADLDNVILHLAKKQNERLLVAAKKRDERVKELCSWGCGTTMHVAHLIAPRLDGEDHTKDIDFSPSGIMQRWEAGYDHTRSVLAKKPWIGEFDPLSGVVLHEHTQEPQVAAE